MATLLELARLTNLDGPSADHLQRLVATWGFLADLCFADLLLFVPTAESGETGEEFMVVGQIRPTTSQTLYREDQVGHVVTPDERPDVARAWHLGQIIDDERRLSARGEVASIQCIPVRWKETLLGVLTRESAPSVGRRLGELERVYVEIFDRFARMMAGGEFPFEVEEPEPNEAPRVGDGVARLDDTGRVDYGSPNFISALHRMGIHGNARGARLGELGMDESAVRAAFAIGVPITEEVEHNDVTLLVRCIPLLDRGTVTGAVVAVRDVSDLRRRDRLLISKDVTIREMHHRVKNNLQTISSLLRLQARRLESPEAQQAIEDAVARIRSIALVHETLSASTGASQEVDFDDIVRPLVRWVGEGLLSPDRRVRLLVEGEAGALRAEVATPLSVVLTELLQNAVRHGFPEDGAHGGGTVRVSLDNDGIRLLLRVVDDGVGFPEGLAGASGLGLTIVRTLVAELGGELTIESAGGACFELAIPLTVGRDATPLAAEVAPVGPMNVAGLAGQKEESAKD
ncbi:MAG: sensor histidine kinase [Actinobacteria bacterium]|nr:sensor histidine kinase [Actinomycetota bacterium]